MIIILAVHHLSRIPKDRPLESWIFNILAASQTSLLPRSLPTLPLFLLSLPPYVTQSHSSIKWSHDWAPPLCCFAAPPPEDAVSRFLGSVLGFGKLESRGNPNSICDTLQNLLPGFVSLRKKNKNSNHSIEKRLKKKCVMLLCFCCDSVSMLNLYRLIYLNCLLQHLVET